MGKEIGKKIWLEQNQGHLILQLKYQPDIQFRLLKGHIKMLCFFPVSRP